MKISTTATEKYSLAAGRRKEKIKGKSLQVAYLWGFAGHLR